MKNFIPIVLIALVATFGSKARRCFAIFGMKASAKKTPLLAVLLLAGCGGIPPECQTMPIVDCPTAQAYQACIVKNTGSGITGITRRNEDAARVGARDIAKTMCGNDGDGKKGTPYQQVCPEGAACNQGVN